LKEIDKHGEKAAASRILMIGSSNFSKNFSHKGSRGNGVSLLVPKRPALRATASDDKPLSATPGKD